MPLRTRELVAERMDDPALPARDHDKALAGLARLNAVARSAALVWPAVRAELHAARAGGRTVSVLDVATGSGDIPAALARLARRERLEARWIALDASAHALERARVRAEAAGLRLECHVADATQTLPVQADVVISSLFVHHLSQRQAVCALRAMAGSAQRRLVVSDLRRSVPGLALAWAASRALSRSPVVHYDATASVRGALSVHELSEIARDAGLAGASVRRAWPQRMVLEWRRQGSAAP